MHAVEDLVTTKSMWLAAYLLAKGYKLVTFKLLTPTFGRFAFESNKRIQGDIVDYYGSNPEIPIKEYMENYNALRDLVMRTKRGEMNNGEQRSY